MTTMQTRIQTKQDEKTEQAFEEAQNKLIKAMDDLIQRPSPSAFFTGHQLSDHQRTNIRRLYHELKSREVLVVPSDLQARAAAVRSEFEKIDRVNLRHELENASAHTKAAPAEAIISRAMPVDFATFIFVLEKRLSGQGPYY